MASQELGAVIAERHLELVDSKGNATPCFVRVGVPIPDGKENWVCPYQIEAGQRVKTFGMHGIDSMQALVLTLETLDVEIEYMARQKDTTVRYLDGNHESVFNP